jgi:predicted ATPase
MMLLLAQSGQRSAALAQYGTCRQVLADELGVEPGRETTALYEAILAGEIAAPVEVSTPPAHNLPLQPTPFVGRKAELAELGQLLADPEVRLVTVLGAGGMGKTRLALEAAAACVEEFEQGVFFVSLAPLRSAEAIVPTVAEALSFTFYEGGEPRQQLLDYLRRKRLLLVMDNYEHLLTPPQSPPQGTVRPAQRSVDGRKQGGGADLVSEILQTASGVKVLATSRARLNVQGEQLFHLGGMDYPDWETPEDADRYSAVELFLQSARRARADFELRGDDLTYLTRICRLVGGMPLGILLAAAWVEMLTPAEIAAEIGRSLDFLESELRDVPARQRSMRAVFDHSWRLLAEREQEVFQGLSVFRGGFTREAAEAVTGASLRELMALVNKSLLHRTPVGRYEVHELLRQYAAEKLDQVPTTSGGVCAVRDRHCAYYAAALERWAADLEGLRQGAALAEMRADQENARAAWDWAVERGQVGRLDQAVEGLCHFYEWRGREREGETACRIAAEKLKATTSGDGIRALVKILTWQSHFSSGLGPLETASQLLKQSLTLLERPELADQDTRAEKAAVLQSMGYTARDSGDWEGARRLFEQSLALYQALGDRWSTALGLASIGFVAMFAGALGEAQQFHREALALRRALGDQRGVSNSIASLSWTALLQGQFEEAERLLRESLALRQEIGDRGRVPLAYAFLGRTLAGQGRYEEARAAAQLGVTTMREMGSPVWLGYCLQWLGSVVLAGQAYAEAQAYLQESVALLRETGNREQLGWALAGLGYAARGLGDLRQAGQHLNEALRAAVEIGAFAPLINALPAIALLLADRGEVEQAVELYALASRYPFVANARWLEDVAGKNIAAVAAILSPEVVAAAQERGKARDLWATVEELLADSKLSGY